ncbi:MULTISPECIES: glucosaminidase domain-containing protein [unclassified Elizabethkingia]|uniref:glucosaminidase domain-containing protein n=1 Tax=Elizabethkingia sp. YR214 TaxID=2135667 RepID=UPI000D326D6B
MGNKKWCKIFKHIRKDYFRKYKTPEKSFTDHANSFFRNKRYAAALTVKSDPNKFIDVIATAPDYAKVLKDVVRSIVKFV